jgi:putative ABC transport system permease protein
MLAYYFQLGLRSLRRNSALTALMIVTIGFGVAASMTTYSVLRAMSGDPIPEKSEQLFVPQIDAQGPDARRQDDEPPYAMTYIDAMALVHAHRAPLESPLYPIAPTVFPDDSTQKARSLIGHAVYAQFFPMADVPFRYGGAWSGADDERHAAVAVISASLNQRLFGNANSIGKDIRLDNRAYRVVGVLDAAWSPQPKFYDLANSNAFGAPDQVFLPFATAIDQQMATTGGFGCGRNLPAPGFAGTLSSDCVWISYLAELDTPSQVRAYRDYLDGYARAQQKAGRFGWAPNNRLRDLPAWSLVMQVVPPEVKLSVMVALFLLLVCMVNAVGLLLAKFLRRSGEIGVRRALGASRGAIARQFGMESATIGLAGGLLGLLMTWLGVSLIRSALPIQIAVLTHVDLPLLWRSVLLAIIATVLAGLYPIWRAAHVRPALQLKTD